MVLKMEEVRSALEVILKAEGQAQTGPGVTKALVAQGGNQRTLS